MPPVLLSVDLTTGSIQIRDANPDQLTTRRLATALRVLLCPDDTPLASLNIIPDEERDLLLSWATAPTNDRSSDHLYSPMIHRHFERVARRSPDSIALELHDHSVMTYGELDRSSQILASYFRNNLGLRRGDMVLEYFDKGSEMIVAMLAILKAGAAYVPLDVEHPAARVAAIQNVVKSKLCLSTSVLVAEAMSKLPSGDQIHFLNIDEFLQSNLSIYPPRPFPQEGDGQDICYVMFTSGSSGIPKGVMVQHASVVACSVLTAFTALTSGGRLCIAPKYVMLNDMEAVLNDLKVTLLIATPTVLSLVDPNTVPTLSAVISGGEPLTVAIRDKFQDSRITLGVRERGIRLGNGGGPTETAMMSVFGIPAASDEPNFFGRPFGQNQLYILDSQERLCPVGTLGQLWIGGPQVSKGYLGQDNLTARVFKSNAFQAGSRIYNTGDLCSWNADGNVLYWGRSDLQVKIRGQRIEIGEIESTLISSGKVRTAGVIKRVTPEELVAFVDLHDSDSSDAPLEDLKQFLLKRLPRYMVPSTIISLSPIPTTLNGKTDRNALEQLARISADLGRQARVALDRNADDTPTKLILSLWASVLSIPESSISYDADFFTIGGDSISAIRVAAACRDAGHALNITDFVACPTPRSQASLIKSRWADSVLPSEKYVPLSLLSPESRKHILEELYAYDYREGDIEDVYPCTGFVGGLISLAAVDPSSYFAQYTFERQGFFNPDHIAAAWQLVWKRHPILRTIFITAPPPYRDIVQVVLAPDAVNLPWSFRVFETAEEQTRSVQEFFKTASGFALGRIPTSVAVFQGPHSSITALHLHHSQYDGWSLPIMLKDVETAYSICSSIPDARFGRFPASYSRFVQWVRNQNSADALAFWKSQLMGAEITEWPPIPLISSRAARTDHNSSFLWSSGRELEDFCRRTRITMSSVVRTALAVTLGLHSHSEDVVFGVVSSGRTGNIDNVDTIVGPCISTLPCRVRLPRSATLSHILESVHAHSIDSIPFQFVGLSDILQATGTDSGDLFNVLLTIENLPGLQDSVEHEFFGRNTSGHWLPLTYPFAVTVFPSPDNAQLRFDFQWDSGYVSGEDVQWFQSHMFAALEAVVRHPHTLLHEVGFISDIEASFIRSAGTGGASPPTSQFFHLMVDSTAHRIPTHIAVQHTGGESMTYNSLVKRANQVAHGLQRRGVGPEVLVPILFDKNRNQIWVVVAILSILKAGGAFIPLDSSWPIGRLKSCISQTRSIFIISDAPDAGSLVDAETVNIDDLALGQPTFEPPTPLLQHDSLSYCLFTSGSTGLPKGVLIEHINIVSYIANASTEFPLSDMTDVKRILHFSPWTFDQALADLFFALSRGATLLLADMTDMLSNISHVLNTTRADYIALTPAIAQLISPNVDHPFLKSLLVGGEKLPRQLSDRWREKVTFVDLYGPTEATVHCISARHTAQNPPAPGIIGRPLAGMRAYVLDSSQKLCPVGVSGELCVAGNQVGRGYLDLADQSAAVFIPDPFAPGERMYRTGDLAMWTSYGQIKYLGRQEGGLVKLRGLRVDVAEIESVLATIEDTVAVVHMVELDGHPHLLAFLSRTLKPAGQSELSIVQDLPACRPWVAELLLRCRSSLPQYAIPTLWLVLDAIPQANSNKLDRKLLAQFYNQLAPGKITVVNRTLVQTEPPRGPETATETMVYNLYVSILGREDIFVHDDFNSIGGDSITNIRILAALRQEGYDVTVKELYAAGTIAQLAQIIDAKHRTFAIENGSIGEGPAGGLVVRIQQALPGYGSKSAIWLMHDGKGLIGPEYGYWEPLGPDVFGIANPATDEATLIEGYDSWKCIVGQYLPLIPATESVYLGGWSSGGNLALAMAAERVAQGLPVHGVILLDPYNAEGFTVSEGHTYYPARKGRYISKPRARQLAHLKHSRKLMENYVQPKVDVPVLLIRAGTSVHDTLRHYNIPEPADYAVRDSRYDTNFFTRERITKLEVITIEDADHKSLVQNPAFSGRVSALIRKWCEREALFM
ncbi:acetyl-CoA synthetase-like protein [Mycena vulgaris]|nr:acetyl-CoA synthetase-like protein [Mycena vulgaris]